MPELVTSYLVTQSGSSDVPTGCRFESLPSTAASAFKVNDAAQWGTNVTVREYRFAALGALVLEQLRIFQCAADEGAQPHRVRGHLGHNSIDAVSHLQIEGNEVELVYVFPLIEAGIDGVCVLVERFGKEPLLPGGAQRVPFEKKVLFHGTDFF